MWNVGDRTVSEAGRSQQHERFAWTGPKQASITFSAGLRHKMCDFRFETSFCASDCRAFSFPSMQRSLHQLGGYGVADRPSGRRQGDSGDAGRSSATCCHRCALQSIVTRHHADRQPEEVSLGVCKTPRTPHEKTAKEFKMDNESNHIQFVSNHLKVRFCFYFYFLFDIFSK